MSQEKLAAEQYLDLMEQEGVAEFASDEPRNYDRVPSIIDHLTYIKEVVDEETGEITFFRKRLTPTEKELYRIFRYRAGSGVCWRNADDLADHVGCSKNTITEAKKSLSMSFEQLEGNSLVDIQEKMVRTMRKEKCINKRPVHCVTIVNIWSFNNAFMDKFYEAGKKRKKQIMINEERVKAGFDPIKVDDEIKFPKRKEDLSQKEAERIIEKMGQPGAIELVHNPGGHPKNESSLKASRKKRMSLSGSSSQNWDVNKDKGNKDHCLKTDQTANAVARCFLTTSDVQGCFASQSSALDWLQRFGFKMQDASKMLQSNSLDQLYLAAAYVKDMLSKKNIDSITGYFRRTLENRWYLPQPS